MGRYRRKRMHKNIKDIKKKYKTKRRTKDVDQIHDDLRPVVAPGLLSQVVDHDLPGSAQHYCITCARYFIDESALKVHFKSKPHKRRLHALKEPVYTQREAEMAAGMGNYIIKRPEVGLLDTIMTEVNSNKASEKLKELSLS